MRYSKKEFEELSNRLSQMTQKFGESVNSEECEDKLQHLIQFTLPDCFFMVINIKKQKVTWSQGVSNYLGYSDNRVLQNNTFTFYDSLDIIHPDRRKQYLLFGWSAYQVSQMYKEQLSSCHQQFMIKIPIRKRNGKFLWVKQTSMPFELDEDNNLISHLNLYYIIGKYKGQPIEKPIIFSTSTANGRRRDWEDLVSENTKLVSFPFSNSEEKLLGYYATDVKKTIQAAAESLKWSVHWVKELNKSILEKGKKNYSNEFQSALEVAIYLKDLGWVKKI